MTLKKIMELQKEKAVKAISLGWLPAKPWKGRLTNDLVGCPIKVGFIDTEPKLGLIVEVEEDSDAKYPDMQIFFPDMSNTEKIDNYDQIFWIGKAVTLSDWNDLLSKNKLLLSARTENNRSN